MGYDANMAARSIADSFANAVGSQLRQAAR